MMQYIGVCSSTETILYDDLNPHNIVDITDAAIIFNVSGLSRVGRNILYSVFFPEVEKRLGTTWGEVYDSATDIDDMFNTFPVVIYLIPYLLSPSYSLPGNTHM